MAALNSINKRSSNTYGLLTNEMTAVMQNENIAPIGKFLESGRKGVVNLNMLYNWWVLYAINKNLIKDNWILPNEVLNSLLADQYIKYGAKSGTPFDIQTYLRMIGNHLKYDDKLTLSVDQQNYLLSQDNILKTERSKYKLNK